MRGNCIVKIIDDNIDLVDLSYQIDAVLASTNSHLLWLFKDALNGEAVDKNPMYSFQVQKYPISWKHKICLLKVEEILENFESVCIRDEVYE